MEYFQGDGHIHTNPSFQQGFQQSQSINAVSLFFFLALIHTTKQLSNLASTFITQDIVNIGKDNIDDWNTFMLKRINAGREELGLPPIVHKIEYEQKNTRVSNS